MGGEKAMRGVGAVNEIKNHLIRVNDVWSG